MLVIGTMLALLITFGIALALWPWIVRLLSDFVIPHVRKILGESVGEHVANFVAWLDNGMCPARVQMLTGWRVISQQLGIQTTYTKLSPTTVRAETTYFVEHNGVGRARQPIQQTHAWEDLPPDVREQLAQSKSGSGMIDVVAAIKAKALDAARKMGLTLES